ncbi:uncharacterized mitochondrial protein AtMg00310-like [Mercurialis annua]|uniref:uncharacterized mitochondrial protein AtMg00310-like n=1 Tax=Mercurialis annua TaxID=3986 RepID=UPI00215F1BB8|nr:uncharacterized mitochondrial protein AtMg00310-like [Mercurialis annua]
MSIDGSYLGLPFTIGRNKSVVFGMLKGRIWTRIQSWKHQFLSAAGKEMLIKSVMLAIPNYYFNVFLIPLSICVDIESCLNAFWWGNKKKEESRGIHWSDWDKLCLPKNLGGMGFRKLRDFNLAMLSKQGWKLLSSPNSLVYRVFHAKYFYNSDFLNAKLGANPSYVWRSLMAAQEIVRKGTRWRIGRGNSLRMELGCGMATVLGDADREVIRKIVLLNNIEEDRLIWYPEVRGTFLVKSAYRMSFGDRRNDRVGEEFFWKWF